MLTEPIQEGVHMKIGITERGDAGIDLSWFDKLSAVDGAIIITKHITEKFKDCLLNASKPVVFHCGVTGWGGTWLEPGNPDYKTQLENLRDLVDRGFPVDNVVLRIDPIIPAAEGLQHVRNVLDYVLSEKIPVYRCRMSVYDEYAHSARRLVDAGHEPIYNDVSLLRTFTKPSYANGFRFYAPYTMMDAVARTLSEYPFKFETCAEDKLAERYPDKFIVTGCVGKYDLQLMGLPIPDYASENPQNRKGCHCLVGKTELLSRRGRCPNGCLYCYWKD